MSKRRGHGEGSIYQRKDGRWTHALDLGNDPTTGKRRRLTLYAGTRSELMRKIADARAKGGGKIKPREPGTIGEFLANWLENDVKPNRAAATYAQYETMVRVHTAPLIGDAPIEGFGPDQVADFYRRLREQGTTSSVRARVATVLHRAFEIRRRRHGVINPVSLVDKPRHKHAEVQILSTLEVRRLIEGAKQRRLGGIFILCVTAGLRIGEALALHWQHVDFAKRRIRIRQALVEVNNILEISATKTERSRRAIPLSDLAIEALQARYAAWQSESHNSPLVFSTLDGKLLRKSNVRWQSYHAILKEVDLPKVTIHSLRHAFATFLAESGTPVRTIIEMLGQTRPGTALQHYLHTSPDAQEEAISRLGTYLQKPPNSQ